MPFSVVVNHDDGARQRRLKRLRQKRRPQQQEQQQQQQQQQQRHPQLHRRFLPIFVVWSCFALVVLVDGSQQQHQQQQAERQQQQALQLQQTAENTNIVTTSAADDPVFTATTTTTSTTSTTSTPQCVAQNHLGQPVLLDAPLPLGVTYNVTDNSLVCGSVSACREWTIANCKTVHCVHGHACQKARIIDIEVLECFDYASCQETTVIRVQDVKCGMDAINACMQMTAVIPTGFLLCMGNNACSSDAETKMIVHVGGGGVIQCMDGHYAYSCQHMLVIIDHARRACFASSIFPLTPCAVICDGALECHKNTIQFRVQG
ncbi:hypothetical protein ACA910_011188 [Epithemia clementina (nom. ined.)]